jgi:hypothetical protein
MRAPVSRSRPLFSPGLSSAIDEARRRRRASVQLTTDKSRADAHRFYARLGFVASHQGLKLALARGFAKQPDADG